MKIFFFNLKKNIENSSLFELVDEKSSKSLKSVLEKKFSHSGMIFYRKL